MKRLLLVICLSGLLVTCSGTGGGGVSNPGPPPASNTPFWPQWGMNSQHAGMVSVVGQNLNKQLADIVYDPFVMQESAEGGEGLLAHFQAPLVDGNDVYMLTKSGTYVPCNPAGDWANGTACGPNTWNQMIWNEQRFTWENGQLVQIWSFQSDWKPEPNGGALGGWEPVFHPVDANNFLYVPGAGGTVFKVNKDTGAMVSRINPFGGAIDQNTFVSGPLTFDVNGNIYYNVLKLSDPTVSNPWNQSDVLGAWLVKVTSSDTVSMVTYATLVPNAPTTNCQGTFFQVDQSPTGVTLPWPPAAPPTPPTRRCGSQRPGVNVGPAIAPDGTIYTVSRTHFDGLVSYLVAVFPDLTPKWQASLQNQLTDGCDVNPELPISADPNQSGACRVGTRLGVDPTTNAFGSGRVVDQSSSSPTVLPDGNILYGAVTNYANARGHLMKFSSGSQFQAAYDFGWDSTAAVYSHTGTYSIVIKDNHYNAPVYCSYTNPICQIPQAGPYFITQLNADLKTIEWQFKNTTIDAMHPMGFEWCINAPAVDSMGTVYANSEDGNIYTINQGGTMKQKIFLKVAIGAAYTPLALGSDGKIYTENNGELIVVGN